MAYVDYMKKSLDTLDANLSRPTVSAKVKYARRAVNAPMPTLSPGPVPIPLLSSGPNYTDDRKISVSNRQAASTLSGFDAITGSPLFKWSLIGLGLYKILKTLNTL
jgi:hypothetical protein